MANKVIRFGIMNKRIVCLGGGIGTVNLIKGLKEYTKEISVIVSMADDGGSTGRLRRLYNILPPGDLVSCMAALCTDDLFAKVITYRFPGNRYGKDDDLVGHKLGNLIMVGLRDVTGDFSLAISLFQKIFSIPGQFFPATSDPVSISAKTIEGKEVYREANIDLGRYVGKKILERVYLHPQNPKPAPGVIDALRGADIIVAGPGDLYTTILPTLIVPAIAKEIIKSKKKKIFVVNIANKPAETKGYCALDYVNAIEKHLGVFPFDTVVINTNFSIAIPRKYHNSYAYVQFSKAQYKGKKYKDVEFLKGDLVDETFPLYHSSKKLAKAVVGTI